MKTNLFAKFVLVALVAVIAVAAFPSVALAAPSHQDPQPGKGNDRIQRLEKRLEDAFARMQGVYERQGNLLGRADVIIGNAEKLIAKANEKGLDASAVEAALANFAAALPAAQAAYDQSGDIIAAHTGFDDKGKVTDAAAAAETVKSLHASLQAYREALDGSGKALREAVRQFIQTNKGSFKPAEQP